MQNETNTSNLMCFWLNRGCVIIRIDKVLDQLAVIELSDIVCECVLLWLMSDLDDFEGEESHRGALIEKHFGKTSFRG